jgi:PAB-dependent poly(A)-specific ribonuclease subunit 2
MDTVNIYTIPGRQRKLSLRFLSWFLLKKDIQTQAHDSIEDAKYALLLYKLYLDFEEQNRFEDVMEDIFVEGQKVVSASARERGSTFSIAPWCQT